MYALEVEHLTVRFPGAERPAVEDVSFSLAPGQIAMVIGPNGSGKTTLLRAILALQPATGTVRVFGLPVRQAYPLIGYVPQHLRFDPSLPMTGREVLHMPLAAMPRAARQARLAWAAATFGLSDFLEQPLGTLSGGQLKRLLLARALLHSPKLLVLDEPEAGVDISGEYTLYQLLERLVEEQQLTVLVSSHELNIVLHVATQVLCLNRRLLGMGPPMQVLTPQALFQLYGPTVAFYRHQHGESP
ncbi:MAG: ABC transporter ATP-binding protein [Candidatus Tectimicrobiota bacterium]|nr:MAG: ABC transporter ATP-binding protein [Candidatus Tectomicrobia bacterium]